MVDLLIKVARVADMPPNGPHTLRHTFCSHLPMRGAAVGAIQLLAGHQDLMTTQRYMHLSPKMWMEAEAWRGRSGAGARETSGLAQPKLSASVRATFALPETRTLWWTAFARIQSEGW